MEASNPRSAFRFDVAAEPVVPHHPLRAEAPPFYVNASRAPEHTESFRVSIDNGRDAASLFPASPFDSEVGPVLDETRMLVGRWCDRQNVISLWKQKTRLDAIFDQGKAGLYYEVRDATYPQDRRGSAEGFRGRAGDKLLEINGAVPLFPEDPHAKGTVFLDLWGGPGSFSQMLLAEAPPPVRGYGVSPAQDGSLKSAVWYSELLESGHFDPLWGRDGTGNLLVAGNMAHLAEVVPAAAHIVVADGGFRVHQDAQGHHLENIQELLSHQVWHANGAVSIHSSRARRRALLSLHHQVVIAEMLAMTLTLQEGGTFVVKCFDTFSDLSASLIYTLCLVFRHVTVVKPFRSRSVNSERYLVAKDLVSRDSPAFHGVAAALQRAYDTCLGNPDVSPQSLLPVEALVADETFVKCLRGINEHIATHQTGSLMRVMDAVDQELIKRRHAGDDAASRRRSMQSSRGSVAGDPGASEAGHGRSPSRRASIEVQNRRSVDRNRRSSLGAAPQGSQGGKKIHPRHQEFKHRMRKLLQDDAQGEAEEGWTRV